MGTKKIRVGILCGGKSGEHEVSLQSAKNIVEAIDRETYDAYLRSNQYLYDLSRESMNKARDYLEIAIEKDPDWGPLYTAMTQVWLSIMQGGFVGKYGKKKRSANFSI